MNINTNRIFVYLPNTMIKHILLLWLLAIILSGADVVFKVDTNSITYQANWHPQLQDQQENLRIFNDHLLRQELDSIDISFTYCSDNEYLLDNLFKNDLNAKHVSINLDSCKIGNQGLERVLNKIGEKRIESLKLVLSSTGINQQGIEKLGVKLQRLPLKRLEIEFVFIKLSDNSLNRLLQHPLRKGLEELSIDLVYNKLGSQSLSNLNHFLQNIESDKLKKLALKLGSNKIEEKGSQYLGQSLKRFEKLQELTLDFYLNNLKIKGTKNICQFVKLQKNLKSLSLNFDLNYIETEGGVAIGQTLSHLPSLQSLQIGVANKNFGFNGFNAIVSQIQQLTHLKSLILKAGVNRVGLKGAEKLKQALGKLNLQHFDLGFTQNFISDEGIQVISEALSKQSNIKSLRLNLGFNEARGYGPISLIKTLSSKKYTDLWVGLSNNPLQDKQVKLMIPSIESLLKKSSAFQLQLLNTKVSQELANQIRAIFDKAIAKGYKAVLHIDSTKQSERVRDQLEKLNKNDGSSKATQTQL